MSLRRPLPRFFGFMSAVAGLAALILLSGCGGGGGGSSTGGLTGLTTTGSTGSTSTSGSSGGNSTGTSGGTTSTSGGSTGGRTYLGTQSPGDAWSFSVGSSTFSSLNTTTGKAYSGTLSIVASGFIKFTVNSSTDNSVPVGSTAYAWETPGSLLLVRGLGSTGRPIVAAAAGVQVPGTDAAYNWISMPKANWQPLADEAYGTAFYDIAGTDWAGTVDSQLIDGTSIGSMQSSLADSLGQLTENGGPGIGGVNPNGVFIFDKGPSSGGLLGLAAPTDPVDLAVVLTKEFRGIAFTNGRGSFPAWARRNSLGSISVGSYVGANGVDSNSEDPNPTTQFDLTFTGQPNIGQLVGTIANNGTTSGMIVVASVLGGKYFLFGLSDDPVRPSLFLLAER